MAGGARGAPDPDASCARCPRCASRASAAAAARSRCSSLTLPLWLSNSKLFIATDDRDHRDHRRVARHAHRVGRPREPRADGVRRRSAARSAAGSRRRAGWDLGFALLVGGARRRGRRGRRSGSPRRARAGSRSPSRRSRSRRPSLVLAARTRSSSTGCRAAASTTDPKLFGGIEIETRDELLLPDARRCSRSRSRWRYGIRRSRTGRVLIALRENERAAEAYGVNATAHDARRRSRSPGFLAAIAGVLFVHHQHSISQDSFSNPFSAEASLARLRDRRDRRPRLDPGRDPRRALRVRDAVLPARPSGGSSRPASACSLILLILPGGLGAGARRGARRACCAGSRGAATSSCRASLADRRDDSVDVDADDGRGRRRRRRAARGRRRRGDAAMTMVGPQRTDADAHGAVHASAARPCTSRGRRAGTSARSPAARPRSRCSSCSGSTRSTSSTAPCSASSAPRSATRSASATRASSSLIALTLLGGLLLEVPLAYYADRLPRARIAVVGRGGVGDLRRLAPGSRRRS